MFWGLILEPNKRYTQLVAKPFHISHAALDTTMKNNEPCQVMVVIDGKNFLLCTLQRNVVIQTPLDLYFKQGSEIAFLNNGKCNVHLTGNVDPDFEVSDKEAEVEAEIVEKLEEAYDSSDEEEDNDSEEEEEEEPPHTSSRAEKRKLKSKDEPPKKKKLMPTAQIDTTIEDSSDDCDSNVATLTPNDSLSSELTMVGQESEAEEEEEETEKDQKEDESDKVDISKLSKSQKRRLKKKLAKENKSKVVNGVGKEKEKKIKANKETPQTNKKSLSGGVIIEDQEVGDGPIAKHGKMVTVYYEGRLESNNKIFDKCVKGAGFKFRLGKNEVIPGWDVGLTGMKVGGKRKIVCPPGMAYGAKGNAPIIPPNATLSFNVELKSVK